MATGRLRHRRVLGGVETVVLSPGGTRLALVGEGRVRIWRPSTGALHTVDTARDRPVRNVAFTPDGHTLAVVSVGLDDERITLLDTSTGRTERTIDPGARGPLSLAFSPDGHTLATVSGRDLKTWDVRNGRLLKELRVDGGVAPPVFSPDGRTVAVSGAEEVRLWDLATGLPRGALPTRSLAVTAFAPDGRTLAVGAGGSVALWDVELPDPARAIHDIRAAVGTAPARRSA
ncbi:hypothetical protein P9869_24125 [Streptomyces ossamyceticus]|nr:hypothetical protein [Streptomyces ossamyceticus]